jgi:hypothetical protein
MPVEGRGLGWEETLAAAKERGIDDESSNPE